MAEARLIYKAIITDDKFIRLTEFEQLLYILLIVSADDYGRLPGDLRALKCLVLPSSDRGLEDIRKAVGNICLAGLAIWEEGKVIEVVNFGKYQRSYHRRRLTKYLFTGEKIEGGIVAGKVSGKLTGSDLFAPRPQETGQKGEKSKGAGEMSGKEEKAEKTAKSRDITAIVITFLNEKTGRKYEITNVVKEMVLARISEGYRVDDLLLVIAHKCRQWGKDEKMRPYLRPSTLFRRSHFGEYLAEAKEAMEKEAKK
jgi:uncharacterized phage protein (TIGR02220 family)